jgi:hypothetical protein
MVLALFVRHENVRKQTCENITEISDYIIDQGRKLDDWLTKLNPDNIIFLFLFCYLTAKTNLCTDNSYTRINISC